MKKRGFFVLLAFFITVETSFALSQDLVFSETVYDRETAQIEGKEFSFRVLEGAVSVGIGISGVIIQGGGCKIKDNFNICISNTTFAYKNLTTYEYIYKTNLKVYVIKSSLTVEEIFPKTELLIGEEADVELKLENAADIPSENVVLTQQYPAEILVSDQEGCSLALNKITFAGQVSPMQIRTCKYKIKALSPVTFSLTTETQYFDGIGQKNLTSTDTITVLNESLEVKFSTDKKDITVGDDVELSLSLENINDDEDLAINNFIVDIPKGFIIKDVPKGMAANNNQISWNGKIEKGGSVNLASTLAATRSGQYEIVLSSSYKISKFLRRFNRTYKFDIKCDCPTIEYGVGNPVPGLKTDFIVSIRNPGSLDFKNLKIDYFSNIPEINDYSSAYGRISKYSAIEVLRTRILSPAEDEEYYFNISIAYESPFRQFFVKKETIKIGQGKVEKEEPIEIEVPVEVENPESEEDAGQESEGQEEALEEKAEEEPIIISDEKTKFPVRAVSAVAVIVVLIIAFVLIRVFKGKKEEEEIKPKSDIEAPPDI